MKNDTWKSYNPLAVGYRALMSNVRSKREYNNNSNNNKVYFNYYVFLYVSRLHRLPCNNNNNNDYEEESDAIAAQPQYTYNTVQR